MTPATQPGTGTWAPREPEQPPPPPLRRTPRQKMMAGVCGGLARHFDLDPVVFRVATGVLAVAGGIGLIFYGFAWLLIPADGEEENEARRLLSGRVSGSSLTAVLMALVGCGLFLTMLSANGDAVGFAIVLSFAVGGAAVWSQRRHQAAAGAQAQGGPGVGQVPGQAPGTASAAGPGTGHMAAPDAPPETKAPPPPDAPSWWRDPIVKDGSTGPVPVGYLWGPPDQAPSEWPEPRGQWGAGAVAVPPAMPRAPRSIGGLVFLLALVAGGIGTAAAWDLQPLGTSLQIGLVCALMVFGLGLVVSSLVGRTGFGTLFMTVTTALLLAAVSVVPADISTQFTRTEIAPASLTELRPHYDLANGDVTLDLDALKVPAGETTTVSADQAAGRLRIVVPRDVTVNAHVEMGLGAVRLTDEHDVGGTDLKVTETLTPPAGVTPGGTLDLDVEAVFGLVEVTRAAS
ncbi:PspC domain-containing protein [Streptomyces sp. MUM 203J]|uniref:PspC domain-containing protein n=1 Tax=Streptomyces sp. MUM 203J TaxID=2791990 RepID=UPI001F03CF70|nr:PspC domain-containing protein [Streptomyces sp. MUM 203J]MCH0542250.1 PspC domain-containing protein [Streptomyces sp. MUM 203J]